MANDWTEHEDRVTVEAYLEMLFLELRGQPYNKSAFRRQVLPKLNDRSNGSLEFKNCNISAALLRLGYPAIDGYKPRWNFQHALLATIEACLLKRPDLLAAMETFVRAEPQRPDISDLLSILDPDSPSSRSGYETVSEDVREYHSKHRNFLEIESRNRAIGRGGEELVVLYEKNRLSAAGKDNLADRIEHVAADQGDGAGFDIRSFDTNGADLFIEVKTTRLRKEAPFFITAPEVAFSRSRASRYSLYRVYHYDKSPRLFELRGDISTRCRLAPTAYRATF